MFGAEVVSFAARTPEALLLIDPLLPEQPAGELFALLDGEASRVGRIAILTTMTYHVRSSEALWERYRHEHTVSIHRHPAARKRLTASSTAFAEIAPEEPLPGGAVAHPIGRPRRFEQPLHLPSHDAVVFGDAVVGVDGELRVWAAQPVDEWVRTFYRERFCPTLEPLVKLGAGRMLMTHGASVLSHGSEALQQALEAEPWSHR